MIEREEPEVVLGKSSCYLGNIALSFIQPPASRFPNPKWFYLNMVSVQQAFSYFLTKDLRSIGLLIRVQTLTLFGVPAS